MTLRRWCILTAVAAVLAAVPACKGKKKDTGPAADATGDRTGDDANGRRTPDGAGDGAGGSGGPTAGPAVNAGATGPRGAALRQTSQNNLKMIGLALHNFHDQHGSLPAGIADPAGKKLLLSWRVAVLPFLEQEGLFNQFKLDEPWDGPTNKKLIGQMPKLFAAPGTEAGEGKTHYRGFTGRQTALGWLGPAARGGPLAFGTKLLAIPDGTANTAAVVEAAEAVVWTKPDELPLDKLTPKQVGGVFPGGFHALLCDGSVRFVSGSIDPTTLRNFADTGDGQVLDLP